jgi:hypothetical protein
MFYEIIMYNFDRISGNITHGSKGDGIQKTLSGYREKDPFAGRIPRGPKHQHHEMELKKWLSN